MNSKGCQILMFAISEQNKESKMFTKVVKASVLMGIVSLLIAGMTWGANWKFVEFNDENSYEGGEVEFLPDGFIIKATGGDIWGGKVGCTYAYMDVELSGDFTVEYTIEEHTVEPPLTWSKCGVMIAQELDPETAYVFVQSTPSNDDVALNDKGTKIITRAERGGDAGPGSNGWAPLQWPVTYKIVRTGDLFTVSVSFDGGTTYQSIANPDEGKEDNTTVVFQDPVIVGIALNGNVSDDITSTATAKIADIMIDGVDVISAVAPAGKLATTWSSMKIY